MAKIYNSRLLPLRFYTSKDDKLANKDYMYDDGKQNLQLCPENTLIDFQIIRDASPDTITDFKIYTENDVVHATLDTDLLTIRTVINENNKYDVIIYNKHELEVAEEMDCGIYYLLVSDGTNTWYSEDFEAINYSETF